jgi:putative MATE family efflux protein
MDQAVKAPAVAGANDTPRFVTGSTMRHVLVMTGTGAAGLIAIFLVDLVSLLYIARFNNPAMTAGVGIATTVMFLTVSINVGLMIPIGALVSQALGARMPERARQLATSGTVLMVLVSAFVALFANVSLPWLLHTYGASREVEQVATSFLRITLPTHPVMALGMALTTVLRAAGDAKRSMYATLWIAVVTVCLDPLFIFTLGLKSDGAAISIGIARFVYVYVGYRYLIRNHGLLERPAWAHILSDSRPFFMVAVPAILTNMAAPAANMIFTGVLARFGDDAIAGSAAMDRLTPVAFGGLFALAGAIGPVMGQNWGAHRYDRMRQVLKDALTFMIVYVLTVWLILFLIKVPVADAFNAQGDGRELLLFFCNISGLMWLFIGLIFVSNASFNNLGFPLLSTAFNWGRATLGMIPFAFLGAHLAGPKGALAGIAAGSVIFGILAIFTAFWTIRRLKRHAERPNIA